MPGRHASSLVVVPLRATTEAEPRAKPGAARWVAPAVLALTSLLSAAGAAAPALSYYFRDFTVTFYPLRAFVARELAGGRWPAWNPYVQEGAPAIPVTYPLDLLLALIPGPVAASWLLTLHLPLSALGFYWLARELGADRLGAFAAGAAFALGGLAASSVNLYVFLQALALAPFLVLALRRALRDGGRSVPLAGLALGLALTTLAVEFVVQAVILGVGLGLAARPRRAAIARCGLALAIGVLLAGVPLALIAGMLPETVRGGGFGPDVALANDLHPAVLFQVLVPDLFGPLRAPVEGFWGQAFHVKGFPYFLSLYAGPVVLAAAASGLAEASRRDRRLLMVAAAGGLVYALGARGGLAPLLSHVPGASAFRFPIKAIFLPYAAVSLFAGLGVSRLRRGQGWRAFCGAALAFGTLALALGAALLLVPGEIANWAQVAAQLRPNLGPSARDAALTGVLGLACAGLAARILVRPREAHAAAILVSAAIAGDLGRAGAGLNPQVPAGFFDLLPESAAERRAQPPGTRTFSYGLDHSPAFRAFLARGGPGLGVWSFFAARQMLTPYCNLIDSVESADAKDITGFVLRPPEILPEEYDPAAVGALLPKLRNASVSQVWSLDPLSHPELELRRAVPLGPPSLDLRVYSLRRTWARQSIACRAVTAPSREAALALPLTGPDFNPETDVALEVPAGASCTRGAARSVSAGPGTRAFDAELDGDGYLLLRDSYARGWRAIVDGRGAPVLRANGKHQAVPLGPGRHQIELRYHPPGLLLGLGAMAAGLLVLTAMLWRPGTREGGRC
jgi:hypothetical protein